MKVTKDNCKQLEGKIIKVLSIANRAEALYKIENIEYYKEYFYSIKGVSMDLYTDGSTITDFDADDKDYDDSNIISLYGEVEIITMKEANAILKKQFDALLKIF